MKEIELFCDRCKRRIERDNMLTIEFYSNEYLGLDICDKCDLQIRIAAQCSKRDVLQNLEPGTTLKEWLNDYKEILREK